MYADKYDGKLPHDPGAHGLEQLRREGFFSSGEVFICPADTARHAVEEGKPLSEENVSYIYQPGKWWSGSNDVVKPLCWDKPDVHGANGLGVLFSDGRVAFLTTQMWSRVRR